MAPKGSCLNTWSQVGGTVWEGLQDMALLEEVCPVLLTRKLCDQVTFQFLNFKYYQPRFSRLSLIRQFRRSNE